MQSKTDVIEWYNSGLSTYKAIHYDANFMDYCNEFITTTIIIISSLFVVQFFVVQLIRTRNFIFELRLLNHQ